MARHGKSKARAKRPPPPMPKPSPPRFTMQQAARNTETHNKSWNNESLRHKAVRFVSAGQLEQDEQQNADREEDQSEETPNTIDPKDHSKVAKESSPEADDSPFFIDSIGDRAAVTDLPYPIISSDRLNSDDDESEDEVVFTGRQNTRTPIRIETDGDQLLKSLNIQATQMRPTIPPANPPRDPVQRRSSPDRRHRQRWSPEVEVDMLADYIANIDQDYHAPEQDDVTDVSTAETGTNVRHSATDSADEVAQIVTYPKSSLEIQGQTDEVRMQIFTDGLSKVDLDARSDSSSTSEDEDEDVLEYLEESDEELEETEDQEEDIEMLEELAISHLLHGGNKGRSVGKHGFPSASAFADALESDPYYGFDIMDFERPSLQKKPKGKNAPLIGDYMSSDSELEAQLQRAWQTDRQKKKSKKKEREIMRSQGLLGRDPGDADLKVKYAKGMHIEELISEIRTFLLSSKTSLSLPPMTKHRRKTIHEVANKVNLKSQSRGNGMDRFPVLLKTGRTPQYTRKTISQVDNLLSGKKFNRRLFQSWGTSGTPKPTKAKRTGGGGLTAGVTYTDGEVVGASAPEIGAGNRGRAMLEKMGWSSGTALGASNNKGILLPVAHVVKNSRAGLG